MSYWDLLDEDLQNDIILKSYELKHQHNFKKVLKEIVKNPLSINCLVNKNCKAMLYDPKKMFWYIYKNKVLNRYVKSYENEIGFVNTISDVESDSDSTSFESSESDDDYLESYI